MDWQPEVCCVEQVHGHGASVEQMAPAAHSVNSESVPTDSEPRTGRWTEPPGRREPRGSATQWHSVGAWSYLWHWSGESGRAY